MKSKIITICWGLVLILVSGLMAAHALGYINLETLSNPTWAIAFGILSSLFFLSYFLDGVRKWGWLFPALICAAMTLTMWMSIHNIEGSITGVPIFASLALPFFVGFCLDRKRWGLLIPAIILTTVTILMFIGDSDLAGTGFMFLCSLPFFIVYFWSRKNWWALIPAGVFASLGIVTLLESLLPNQNYFSIRNIEFDPYTSVLLLGFAIPFGVLWLQRKACPTDWAKYPAAALLAAAALAFFLGLNYQFFWAAGLMLLIGIMLLLNALIKKKPAADRQTIED